VTARDTVLGICLSWLSLVKSSLKDTLRFAVSLDIIQRIALSIEDQRLGSFTIFACLDIYAAHPAAGVFTSLYHTRLEYMSRR